MAVLSSLSSSNQTTTWPEALQLLPMPWYREDKSYIPYLQRYPVQEVCLWSILLQSPQIDESLMIKLMMKDSAAVSSSEHKVADNR